MKSGRELREFKAFHSSKRGRQDVFKGESCVERPFTLSFEKYSSVELILTELNRALVAMITVNRY